MTDTENEWLYEPKKLKVFASFEEFLWSDDKVGWVEGDNFRLWYKTDKEDIADTIWRGDALLFQYKSKDYFIESGGRKNGYLIQDPLYEHWSDPTGQLPYIDYPGCGEAKTPEEMMDLPFLDGKTILERFDELRFFEE